MDMDLKNRLIKRLVSELNHHVTISDNDLSHYQVLNDMLDLINTHGKHFFNAATVEKNAKQWQCLKNIIASSTSFLPTIPPILRTTNLDVCHKAIQHWNYNYEIANLPNHHYFDRCTTISTNCEFERLKKSCIDKLLPLLHEMLNDTPVNFHDNSSISNLLKSCSIQLKALSINNPETIVLKEKIHLLSDYHKIYNLTILVIPDNKNQDNYYCQLEEALSGVTEKISLISLNTVIIQLKQLNAFDIESLAHYHQKREAFILKKEAILKLPKHGQIIEIQHEAIALNFSRILGHRSTQSTLVNHNDTPALFIPFDNIELFNQYATGTRIKANLSLTGQTYSHYSTINPVGDGLQRNTFIDDVGSAVGLFYLCSDTDAIGGYNQNKALIDDHTLYIFDQVMMIKDKLGLDRRLNLQPIEFFMKHTRHGQGRNRTLIEDSSFDEKFNGLINLIHKRDLLIHYVQKISRINEARVLILKKKLEKSPSKNEKKRLEHECFIAKTLAEDAQKLTTIIQDRINKIHTVFPHHEKLSHLLIKQSLLFEKLIHMPTLYTADGRPYRHLWTYQHDNPLNKIETNDANTLVLTFSNAIPDEVLSFIKRHQPIPSLTKISDNQVSIKSNELASLSEQTFFPEYLIPLSENPRYLINADIPLLTQAYDVAQNPAIKIIYEYLNILKSHKETVNIKLGIIAITQHYLSEILTNEETSHKGFIKHLLKKYYYHSQQYLQSLIPESSLRANINNAFTQASTLDRLNIFNKVLLRVIETYQLQSPLFQTFITNCISINTLSHSQAINNSKLLEILGNDLLNILNPEQALTHLHTVSPQNKSGNNVIDPINIRQHKLREQQTIFSEVSSPSNQSRHKTPTETAPSTENIATIKIPR